MKKELTIKKESVFSFKARLKSFRFAFNGIKAFFRTQHNAFIHFFMTIAVFIAAIFFHVNETELIALIIVAGFVWTAELFNTSIEKLADIVSKDFDHRIKFIKDVSAAAVLVSSIVAFLTGMIIFIPKILQ